MHLKKRTKSGPLNQIRNKSAQSDHTADFLKKSPKNRRYIADFLAIIPPTCACHVLSIFDINIDNLTEFLAHRLSVGKIVLVPIDIRYFGDILADKSDMLFLAPIIVLCGVWFVLS